MRLLNAVFLTLWNSRKVSFGCQGGATVDALGYVIMNGYFSFIKVENLSSLHILRGLLRCLFDIIVTLLIVNKYNGNLRNREPITNRHAYQ